MTVKQLQWNLRSRVLWRVSGISITYSSGTPLTDREKELISIINNARQEFVLNANKSSTSLGFKSKKQ